MTVRTDLLFATSDTYTANQDRALVTVPTGERWLIREIMVYSQVALVATQVTIYTVSGASIAVLQVDNLAVGLTTPIRARFVVARAADVIHCLSAAAATLNVSIFGARLVLP